MPPVGIAPAEAGTGASATAAPATKSALKTLADRRNTRGAMVGTPPPPVVRRPARGGRTTGRLTGRNAEDAGTERGVAAALGLASTRAGEMAGEHRNRTDPSTLAGRRNGFEDRGGHQAAILSRGLLGKTLRRPERRVHRSA